MITAVLGYVVAAYTALVPTPHHPPYDVVGRDAYTMCLQMLSVRMASAQATMLHPLPADTPAMTLGFFAQPFPAEYRFSGVRHANAVHDISNGCLRFLPPELPGSGGRLEVVGERERYHYDYSYGPGQELSRLYAGTEGGPVDVIVG